MKSVFALAAIAATLITSTAFAADAGADLAGKKGCLGCHKVDTKLIGPAYKDVAAKYKSDKTAVDRLVKVIINGTAKKPDGSYDYRWGGPAPMPALGVNEAEAKQLVAWVLSQK